MRLWRLSIAGTACVFAAASWVSRGSIAVADAAAWPRRMGLLPSPWLALGGAAVLAAALFRTKRSTLLPILFPAVLVLPWLPVPVPSAALVWTGSVAVWVWAATGLALVAASWHKAPLTGAAGRWLEEPRRASLAALALAFVLFCAGARLARDVIPGGDEPHYLVITQSLLQDHDLQIENNHRRGDYKAYFPGELRPDFLRRGTNEAIYSIHAPGLPALVLPAFAAAGYPGVVVFLAFLSAVGTWLVWRTGYNLTGSAGAAWFGWATVALSVPYFFHAFTVYPDATGSVVILAAVTALLSFEPGRLRNGEPAREWPAWRWAGIGAALGFLPWLHTRYAVASVVLGLCLAIRLAGRRAVGRFVAMAVPAAVGFAAWFGYFYAIYGEFSPSAPYGHYTQSQLSNIPRALPALLLDQQFGVVPNAPVYAVALLGLVPLFRARRRLAVEILAVLVPYLMLVAAFHMWWGGWSAPARFTVPVLPLLGLPAAVLWSRSRAAGKAAGLAALTTAALVTASLALVDGGALIYNDRDGYARWLEWITPVVDLPHALPSFLRDTPARALAVSAVWAAALLLGGLVLRVVARRAEKRGADAAGRLSLAAPASFAAAIMLASSIAWSVNGVGGATPSTSGLALLRSCDPAGHPLGVQFRPLRRVAAAQMPDRISLGVSERRPPAPDGPLMMLVDVPAGVYRLSPGAAMAAQGTVEVFIGRSTAPIERWTFDPAARGRSYDLRLPTGVNSVTFTADALARRSAPRFAIDPASVVPARERPTSARAARAARYGELTAFSFDAQAYLEPPGIWVEGGAAVPLAFTGDPASPAIRLLLRNAPVANRVVLTHSGRSDVLTMGPGEERVVELPAAPPSRGVFVVVRTDKGYRPADVDPASQDRRYLGVWIQGVPR